MSDNRKHRRQETWKAADVLCPFYMKDSPNVIECEGFLEGTSEVLRFRHAEEKNKHMGIHCAGRFDKCLRYQNVYQHKYTD